MRRILALGLAAVMIAGCTPAEAEVVTTAPTTSTTQSLPSDDELPEMPANGILLMSSFQKGQRLSSKQQSDTRIAFAIKAVESLRAHGFTRAITDIEEASNIYAIKFGSMTLNVMSDEDGDENVLHLYLTTPSLPDIYDTFEGILDVFEHNVDTRDIYSDVVRSSSIGEMTWGDVGSIEYTVSLTGSNYSTSIIQGWDLE